MIERQQKRFLSSLAAILAKIAQADGVVTGDEIASIGAIWQQLGLTSEQCLYCTRQQMMIYHLEEYATEYVSSAYGSGTKTLLYGLLWEVACADGILHRNEVCALSVMLDLAQYKERRQGGIYFREPERDYSRYEDHDERFSVTLADHVNVTPDQLERIVMVHLEFGHKYSSYAVEIFRRASARGNVSAKSWLIANGHAFDK